jgi:hypothetical protein
MQGGTGQDNGSQPQGSNASGSGLDQGGAGEDVTSGKPNNPGPIDPNMSHGDGTVRPSEPVYAPSFVGGSGGQQINPKSDKPGDNTDPVQQVNSSNTSNGQSTVPLNQVSGQAAAQADRAMDSDHVPGALRGVIRDYFTGLQDR